MTPAFRFPRADGTRLLAQDAIGWRPAWFDQLPKMPVHGEVRVTLFFD